jgi:hypothetical protein
LVRAGSIRDFVAVALKHKRDGGFLEEYGGENLENCVEGVIQTQTFFCDGDEGVSGHSGPDLNFDGVGGCSKEAFDTQVLFDPFKKQFDLPALVIDRGDSGGRDLKIVGEEDESLIDIGSVKADTTKQYGEILSRVLSGKNDGLVAADTGSVINRMRLTAAKPKVVLGTNYKVGQRLMEAIETRKVQVAAIHDDEASGLWDNTIQHVRIARMSACNVDEHGNSALNIEQSVHLHGSSGTFMRSPGEQRQAEIDD